MSSYIKIKQFGNKISKHFFSVIIPTDYGIVSFISRLYICIKRHILNKIKIYRFLFINFNIIKFR